MGSHVHHAKRKLDLAMHRPPRNQRLHSYETSGSTGHELCCIVKNMMRCSFIVLVSWLLVVGCSSAEKKAGADPQPTEGKEGSAEVGTLCATEGATCGVCKGPPGPLYVCKDGKWVPEIAGYCDDDLPGG